MVLLGDVLHISEQLNTPECSGGIRTLLLHQPLPNDVDCLLIYEN